MNWKQKTVIVLAVIEITAIILIGFFLLGVNFGR